MSSDKTATHDEHGLQLAPHHLKGRDDVWWYEEAKGLVFVVEPQSETTQFTVPWRSVLAAIDRYRRGRTCKTPGS